ncbi:MarR family transcriptional regulator [Dechloromonas agitata]|uniref:MarR family winged helix-turn-helix transcriptional regulator n=1 Tax=Dechloromonas agitata TaxID=73030 RepID=UPI00237D7134|nr:MarR family transcriptional regulator [Dechloromonas agitata]MDE1545732.1 MarR family transcriptional regulator [Dechloromonas agitata]
MGKNTSLHTHQWDNAIDPQIAPLFLALQWAHRRSIEQMQPLLAEFRLSSAEFDVLATLRNAPPPYELTPSQVQDEVVITSGGLTKVMLQLASRGLVERPEFGDDRRVKPVRLTAAGITAIEAAMSRMIDTTGQWIRSALAAGDIAQLTALLRQLIDAPERAS